MDGQVKEGKRDQWGRDKARLEEEEEKDPKVAWERGMESVKDVGSSVIEGAQEGLERGQEKAEGAMKQRYFSLCRSSFFFFLVRLPLFFFFLQIWKRVQSDPEYRQALETLFSILQDRLHTALGTVDPTKDITLSSFITDPTPEQHIPKGITLLRTFFERLAGKSSSPSSTVSEMRWQRYCKIQS